MKASSDTYHETSSHASFDGDKKSTLGRETHNSILEAYRQKKNIDVSLNEAPLGSSELVDPCFSTYDIEYFRYAGKQNDTLRTF